MFGLAAVSLLEHRPNGSGPYVVASAGERPPEGPGADVELPVSDTFTLAARGPAPGHQDMRVLFSCASRSWPASATAARESGGRGGQAHG